MHRALAGHHARRLAQRRDCAGERLLSTLLDGLGLKPAPGQRFDGISILPALRGQPLAREATFTYPLRDFHTDNGGEFLNWALYRHLREGPVKTPWTRSRAYRKNDNAHCEQKNWTHVRQLFGHERFGHPELVALMNDLYAQEWSQFTNHCKPTFKLLKREQQNGRTKRIYEPRPQTPMSGCWAARTLRRRRRWRCARNTRGSIPLR